MTGAIYCSSAYILLTFLSTGLLSALDGLDEDFDGKIHKKSTGGTSKQNAGEREEGYEAPEEWDEEDVWFIPLGLWAKKKPREFYKGSDQEWQEFVRFSKDSKAHEKARSEELRRCSKQTRANLTL